MITFGPVEENVKLQMENCLAVEEGARGVLCADNHLGYSMPIGGVVAYEGLVSPSAVGYDIGCGNCAVKTEILADELPVAKVMDDIWRSLSFGVGRKNNEKVEHPILDEIAECQHPFQRGLIDTAAQQLGTIGSGNHYVDLFRDREDGLVWIGVHFGSRGFGHKTATWALEKAGATNTSMMAPPVVISAESELGALYLEGMNRAGGYAYAGRDWVIEKVLGILGTQATQYVHNHHNFAWTEQHAGRWLFVHRKGATPAFPGQRGFVGGTMGDDAVILEGIVSQEASDAMFSTVHGAGRVMSRTQAAGKVKTFKQWVCGQRACARHTEGWPAREFFRDKTGQLPHCPLCQGKLNLRTERKVISQGLIDFAQVQQEIKAKGIELRGAGADEAPACYKRLEDVLQYHAGTVKVLHRLQPIGVAMAGKDEFDPFRD